MADHNTPDLDAIRARLKAITPGQWTNAGYNRIEAETDERYIYICQTTYDDQRDTLTHNVAADTDFIANASADLDWCIRRIEALEGALREIGEQLPERDLSRGLINGHIMLLIDDIARRALDGGAE